MERFSFPHLVGDTSFERVRAIICDTIGDDTSVEFKVFWHDRNTRIKKHKLENNVVVLHMDKKWNCVLKTPLFQGYLHNNAEYEYYSTTEEDA